MSDMPEKETHSATEADRTSEMRELISSTPAERSKAVAILKARHHGPSSEEIAAPVSPPRGTVPALVHAISIISYLNDRAPEPATLAEIAGELKISKSHTHSILKTLTYFDWLQFDSRLKTYALQSGVLSDVSSLLNYPSLDIIRTALSELVAKIGVPCILTQPLADRSFVVIDTFRSKQFMQMFYPVGHRFPESATAQMRALLAWQAPELIDEWLTGWRPTRHTEWTLTDKAAVRREIEETRKRGYARSVREFAQSMTGLALPLFDRDGKVGYVISIAYLTSDASIEEETLVREMRDAVAEIHRATLARVPPGFA